MNAAAQKPVISSHRGQQVVVHGRRRVSPIITGPRRLLAHQLLEAIPAPPDEVDYIAAVEKQVGQDMGAFLNNRLGCCTIADGPGHFTQVWSANTGTVITPPDSAILKAYETVDGYVDGDPSTDQGGVETDVLAAWQRGIDGFVPIDAWIPVNLMNLDHVRKAIWKFGGVYTGIGLPLSFQDEDVWYVDLSEGERAEAGSWGGHAMGIHAYFRDLTYDGITWGRRQKETQDALLTYSDEGYVPLCSALWCRGGKSPAGDTAQALLKMLQAVG